MRITSKGQVTIPQRIREQAGLLPHTEVEVVLEDGRVILRPSVTSAGVSRVGAAVSAARRTALSEAFRHKTADEIMAFLRGDA